MRVTLLFFAIVNVVLLGFLVTTLSRPGVPLTTMDSNDRVSAILTRLQKMTEATEKQAGLMQALQTEVTTTRKDLADLRTALVTLEAQSQKGGEDFQAASAKMLERLEKTLSNQPQTSAKQMTELAGELKRLNEQFKRVVDFAAGRGGL